MKGHTVISKPAPGIKNKHEADNQKRLMAIKENMKLKQAQQSFSLKDVDSKSHGQRIVFKDDTSDDDNDEAGKDLQKKLTLFDSGDEDEDEDEDIFKSKPHMEGKKGEKLMRLEQKIGDPRFKLDARFALSDSEEDEDYEERNKPLTDIDKSLEEEKLANLKVLENIVGKTTLARFSEKLKRNVKHITDMNTFRFDPTKIQKSEAASVDKKQTPQADRTVTSSSGKLVGTQTKAVKKVTDSVKKPTDTAKKVTDDVKKTAVNVVSSLGSLFRKEEAGSFSLQKHFEQQTNDEEMQSEDDDHMEGDDGTSSGPLSALFKDQARKASLGHDKTAPATSEALHSEGLGSTPQLKHQTGKANVGQDKTAPTKSGSVHSEEDSDNSSSSVEDLSSDDELLEKDDSRLNVTTTDSDKMDEDLINAGRVDIRFTKEQWLERWEEIRPVLVGLYKRKHKEAMKNKRRQDEFTRKKEFLKKSKKNRFRK